jgi:hypothetical protein
MFYNPDDVKFFKVRKNVKQFLESIRFFAWWLQSIEKGYSPQVVLNFRPNKISYCSL